MSLGTAGALCFFALQYKGMLGKLVIGLASLVIGVKHLHGGLSELQGLVLERRKAKQARILKGQKRGKGRRQGQRKALPAPRQPQGLGRVAAPGRTPGNGMTMTLHQISGIEDRIKFIQERISKGKVNPKVYEFTRKATSKKCGPKWCIDEKDNLGEAKAVFEAIRKNVRYTSDILGVDTYQHPKHTIGLGAGDCFPEGTLLLTDKHEFVPVESIQPGQKIWGLNRWSEVQQVWCNGVLPTTVIELNNGSQLRLTEDHKVYVAICKHFPKKCTCKPADREIFRVPVAELEEGMILIQPEKIDFALNDESDPKRHYIEGLYVSDGWSSHPGDFCISGKDGKPKEEQKREVVRICEELGIDTRWHEKYVTVKSKDWTQSRIAKMGHHAPEKHALSIHLGEKQAEQLLRGIMADSGNNTHGGPFARTLTTTSRAMMLQTRVLQRMFGRSCGYSYIVNHGGLGKNPIYRLSIRDPDAVKAEKVLKIKEIIRNVQEEKVWDITTDDHYVYLPEHDVTVSNCDDYSSLVCSTMLALGIPCRLVVIKTKGSEDWSHIYAEAGFPRANPTRWIAMDASVPKPFGWAAPSSMVTATRRFSAQ